jgi:hypothetical protein
MISAPPAIPPKNRSASRRSLLRSWIVWGIGVALVPVTSVLVPRDGSPYSLVLFLPERSGLLVWASWGLAFGLMFFGMLGLRAVSVRTVAIAQLCASLFIATLTVAAPSTDPFTYVVYGEIAQHGGNPWKPSLVTPNDEVTRVAIRAWENPLGATPYGPLFILGERALLAVVPHTSTHALILAQRFVALLAAIGVTLLVRGPRIAFWGLHPLVLFEFALGAHNDVLMLLFVAASMRIRQPFLSGIAMGLAPMVKIIAFGALLFRPRKGLAAALLGVAVVAVALFALEPKAATFAPMLHVAGNARFDGGTPTYVIQKLLERVHLPNPKLAAQILLVSTVLVLLYRARRRWSRRDAAVYGAMILFALLPIVNLNYVSWILFPTLWASRGIRGVALTLTAAAWLLDLGVFMNHHPHGITLAFWGAVALAYVYFIVLAPKTGDARRIALKLSARGNI